MFGKIYLSFLLFIPALFICKPATAQLQFVENKGQWDSSIVFKGALDRGAFALTTSGGYKMLLENPHDLEAIHYHFHGQDDTKDTKLKQASDTTLILHSHMYEVKFLNANPSPQVVTEKMVSTYNNYFIGNDKTKWASDCKIYQAITFKNIYPHIDIRYYTNKGQLKYDLIVNPGGNAADIALYYDGANDINLKDGNLHVKTSVDEVTELSPYSYQGKETGREEVQCKYTIKNKTVRFKVDDYSTRVPLVIDPTLVFSTFSGSSADNWGYTATYDAAGNFYAGGLAFANGFPATPGAYQQNFAGGNNGTGEGQGSIDVLGFDMAILKFSASGSNLLYGTYIGGRQGNEQPHSMIVDNAGNLIIAGRTTSGDYPTLPPNLIGPGGGQDIVITKLNATGTQLLGSLRIGGTADDGVNIRTKDLSPYGTASIRRNYGDDARSEVIVDAANNIYVASCTKSNSATQFPVTGNAFQQTNKGGANGQDAVIMKFNSALTTPAFISYLGGTGDDAAFVLDLNPLTNDIYVAGSTASTDFSTQTAGTVGPGFIGGVCDGFIAIISNDGTQLKKTTYIGTSAADGIYGIQFDKLGSLYITGTTEGKITTINSPFNGNNNQINGKQFIAKLQPDLSSYVYMSTFGPNSTYPNISPTAFLVDRCQNVYVAGWGGGLDGDYPNSGTSGLTVQAAPDGTAPFKSTTDGADFYFFVMERDANSQLYGSFFGQNDITRDGRLQTTPDHVDGGTSRFDQNGIMYEAICANCGGGTTFPTTPGAYSTANRAIIAQNGYECNEAAIKINMNLSGVAASIKTQIYGFPNDTIGCVPLVITFIDTIAKAKTYDWNFGDGTPDQIFTSDTALHTFTTTGTFHVQLVAIDSSTCNITDTAYVTIRVGSNIITPDFTATKTGGCESLTFDFDNTTTAINPLYGPSTFIWDFGDGSPQQTMGYVNPSHTFPATGTYIVSLIVRDTTFCNIPDTVIKPVTLIANVKAQFTTPDKGCVPYNAVFTNTSLGGTSFEWSFGNGATSTAANPAYTYTDTGTYTVRLIAIDPSTCNQRDTAYFTITVVPRATANFTYSPRPAQKNTPTLFTNTSVNATSYSWSFGDGGVSSFTDPSHQYNSTDTFLVCLVAINDVGCTDTVCKDVPAVVSPLLDVPNAFTPGNGGANAVIKVVGFGIGKMDWKIYNRWGQLVFESTDKNIGWDGTYKGALQPMDVYTYTLDVGFTNNKTLRKTGDISLLR